MTDQTENGAALKPALAPGNQNQSPWLEAASNLTYWLSDATARVEDGVSYSISNELQPNPYVKKEINLMEESSSWNNHFTSNETLPWFFEEAVVVSWFIYLLRYFVIPVLLFYISCVLWEVRFLRMRDPSNPLPLPSGGMGFPIVGEMIQFFAIGTKYQREKQKRCGDVYKTHMFGRPTIMAIGDQHVRRLLLGEGQIVETLWPSMTRKILGEHGIVNGDKQTHTTIKRLALRVFSPKHMGKYAPVVQKGIQRHIEQWEGDLPVLEVCKQMVSRTMMTVLLGIQHNDPAIQNYIQAADDIINSIFTLPINLPGFSFRKGLNAKDYVFKNLEEKLRSKLEASDEELFETKEGDECDSILMNIIKLARADKTEIKLINLQNLSLEFIFAGTQSLQCASASMIVHLSQRPEIVARLRKEIRDHGLWDKPMNLVNFEDLQSLKFADSVIKETMRVTPSIPGCVRVATKTFELGGYQVPKGWQVIYSIKLTHETTVGKVLQDGPNCAYDPDVYFNCRRCENDRSAPDGDLKKRGSSDGAKNPSGAKADKRDQIRPDHVCEKTAGDYSFVPFGKGPRMCAGKNYGLLFLRVMLFQLVRTTNFKLASEIKFSAVPMTKPHKSVKINFQKLSKWQ